MTHACVSKLTIIGSDSGLSSGWRQAIIGNNAELFYLDPLEQTSIKFSIEIHTLSFSRKSIWKCRPENSGHFVNVNSYNLNIKAKQWRMFDRCPTILQEWFVVEQPQFIVGNTQDLVALLFELWDRGLHVSPGRRRDQDFTRFCAECRLIEIFDHSTYLTYTSNIVRIVKLEYLTRKG